MRGNGSAGKNLQPYFRNLNPLTGKVEQEVTSPMDGMVFTLREYPVVLEGSLIARVLEV